MRTYKSLMSVLSGLAVMTAVPLARSPLNGRVTPVSNFQSMAGGRACE